jgi:hypothetical protein
VSVFADEVVARDVTEVFRVNGIAVRARAVAWADQSRAAERDEEQLARLPRWCGAMCVNRGFRRRQQPPRGPAAALADGRRPRQAHLLIVPGNPAYITVDGALLSARCCPGPPHHRHRRPARLGRAPARRPP